MEVGRRHVVVLFLYFSSYSGSDPDLRFLFVVLRFVLHLHVRQPSSLLLSSAFVSQENKLPQWRHLSRGTCNNAHLRYGS